MIRDKLSVTIVLFSEILGFIAVGFFVLGLLRESIFMTEQAIFMILAAIFSVKIADLEVEK